MQYPSGHGRGGPTLIYYPASKFLLLSWRCHFAGFSTEGDNLRPHFHIFWWPGWIVLLINPSVCLQQLNPSRHLAVTVHRQWLSPRGGLSAGKVNDNPVEIKCRLRDHFSILRLDVSVVLIVYRSYCWGLFGQGGSTLVHDLFLYWISTAFILQRSC